MVPYTFTQRVRWQKFIEGAICSYGDVTDDVILMGFGKILGGAKPNPPAPLPTRGRREYRYRLGTANPGAPGLGFSLV